MPCISVWAVATMPNGDVVVGGSDGIARIFTIEKERFASAEELNMFEEAVANQSIPQ